MCMIVQPTFPKKREFVRQLNTTYIIYNVPNGGENYTLHTYPTSVSHWYEYAGQYMISIKRTENGYGIVDWGYTSGNNASGESVLTDYTGLLVDDGFGKNNYLEVHLDNQTTEIPENAFKGCSSLKSVTIPDSVTYIGSEAFAGCDDLRVVFVPNSVSVIGNNAFPTGAFRRSGSGTEYSDWRSPTLYGSFFDLGLSGQKTIHAITTAMRDNSIAIMGVDLRTIHPPVSPNAVLDVPEDYGELLIVKSRSISEYSLRYFIRYETKHNTYYGVPFEDPDNPNAVEWRKILTDKDIPYDKVIRTQTEFDALIGDEDWLDAESVALVGQFTYSEPNNSGIKVPDTVKQIHGFNGAKITVTNFVYNGSTGNGGLWYATRPTTLDYSIRDLEVDCTGATNGYGFHSCANLTNCTGTGTGVNGVGFSGCTQLTNCTGTGIGASGFGFEFCTNLTNCTGTGTGTGANGVGFYDCTQLTNCTGTGTGASGYGFYDITTASNCRDGGFSTAMWGGTNKNIDIDTCRRTPVPVTTEELASLNT